MPELTLLLERLRAWLGHGDLEPSVISLLDRHLAQPLTLLPEPALRGNLLLAGSWQAALANAGTLDPVLLQALAAVVPRLDWQPRPVSEADPEGFQGAHANAILVGAKGLAQSPKLTVGISLMNAGIHYPLHRHPPHEVYFVLSEGEWYQAGNGWSTPGKGGQVYNPPDIVHAMRAGESPLLALWVLVSE